VPGLRREQLALLAGLSASYDTRLEQGQSRGASPDVLDAIARALILDDASAVICTTSPRSSAPVRSSACARMRDGRGA